jgi:16S rRNA (guanine966-N2)-methyltransferase
VRIIAGRHRGRLLAAPPGETVRPTGERAREALFNILAHGSFASSGPAYAGARVLDAFAGTGAFGLEALSRGAAGVVFIENNRAALAALRANIATLGEEQHADIISGDATAPPRAPAPVALAFLDPPYGKGLAVKALVALADAGWLAAGALCVVEMAAKERIEPPPGFSSLDERRYGAARLVFLRHGETQAL